MRSKRFQKSFDKLAAAEDRFLNSEFLAPVAGEGEVRVRIAGVVCKLRIQPADFQGWGVFRPSSHSVAELVREARLEERLRYLRLFPLIRLILCLRQGSEWMAIPAHRGDDRIHITGMAPVRLAEEVQAFEVVRARFDGGNFWFEEAETSRDPATAAYLRQALGQRTAIRQLQRPGLTPEEKAAYAANCYLMEEAQRQREAERTTARLREALEHAGAELVDYLERRDSYRVTFTIGGQQHVSAIRKNDLSVQVAGICLSGQDRQFDLASLIGVIREGADGAEIVPVGRDNSGMEEEQYWDVHPPQNE